MSTYAVIENTPGYPPNTNEPADFETYAEAVAYANARADELEDQGYGCDRSWASSQNTYAIYCERSDTVAPDLGRYIEVLDMDAL